MELLDLDSCRAQVRREDGNKYAVGLPYMLVGRQWQDIDPANYQQVYLERHAKRRDGHTYYTYSIGLEGNGNRLEMGTIGADRHGTAENVARFLNLGMEDRSRGGTVTREAGRLDESLRQQAARSIQQVPVPERPVDPKATCKVEDETVTFVIPGGSYDFGSEQGALMAFVGIGLALGLVHWIIPVMVLFAVVFAFFSLRGKYATPVAVAVSPSQLILQNGGQPAQAFAADGVEELDSGVYMRTADTMYLQVRSDQGFGYLELRGGHSTNQWIISTVRYLLSEDPAKIDWSLIRSWR